VSDLSNIKPFLALIQRSSDIGDGWRKVSPMLRKLIDVRVAEAPGLYETRDDEDGLFIRMTGDAQVLARYI
jgi:uncharacterized protein (DUF736 family)